MNARWFETLVGFFVVVVAVIFLVYAMNSSGVSDVNGYKITAKFERVDGLNKGSEVRISGLKVGAIADEKIDPETYLAVVTAEIEPSIKLPEDSSAEILSDGLLGSKYLAIVPGGSETMLKDGGEITITQSSISIESLIGKFIYGSADDGKSGGSAKDTPQGDGSTAFPSL